MKSVFILLCSFVFGSSIIFSQSSSDCFLSPSNVSILDELKSQTFCSSDDHLSNYKLDKNGINLYDQSGIYTIKLKAHIIQYSANDPRNYTTADIPQILTAIDNVNTIYSSLASTSLTSINPPLVPLSQEESDSRIRFSLSSNDIEFVVDPVNHIGLEDQIHTINTSILEVIDSKTIIVSGQYTADMMYSTQKAQYIIISGSQDNDGWYRFQSANVVIENGQLAVKTKISLVDDLNNVSDLTGAVNYSSFNYTYDNYHNLYHATDKTAIHIYFQKIGTQYYNIGFGSAKELNSNMLSMVNSQGPNGSIDHKLLAHELGHCLGLPHTWNLEYEKPQINDLYWDDNLIGLCNTTTVSNNILGYNTCRNYLSPLQIAYIRKQLNSDINIMQKVIESQQSNNNNVTITGSNVIWDQREIIGGTLTVESGATLTIKCKVHFSPDGKVVVKPNGRLIIDGGLLTNELGQQWKGIEVWGTTTQHQYPTQQPTYQGRLELKNGGTIENALIAASNWKPQDYNKVGGVIISNGGVFLNNRQAIEMVTYDNFIPGNPSNKVSNLTSFTNTDFTINDDYLGDKNAFFYHVTLWDVFGINFQNCHFTNDIAQKSFLGSRNKGIYTLDAGFTVKAGCTSTPPLGQQCPTQNLLKSTFSGFHMGIEATGAAVEQAVSVSQSVFDNNIMGIDFETLDNFSVNRNTIKIGNPGYTDYTSTYFSIRSNLSTGFQIEENNVEKYNGIPNTYGISVSSAGIANNRVYKNRTEGMMYGQYYVGVNRNALNQYEGLQFLCNEFDGNTTAVKVNSMLKNNGIRKYQGDYSPNKSAGNTFLNTPSGALTIDNTTTSGITYYHNGVTTIPTNNTANITLVSSANSNTCPSSFATQQSMMLMQNEISDLEDQYVDLEYNYLALIDNGNTPDFIEQIKTTWSSDAWSLRDQLIAESPYVSQKAILEAVSKNVMPNAMILELCLANPDATQDESFIDKLKEASQNELPDYLLEYIRENWDEKTVRSILESQMGEIAFEKNLIVNNLLREELLQEEHNQTNILGYIEQQSGVELKINQIELTISQENWQEANAILASNIIDENLKDALYVFEDFQEYINFRSSLNERKLSQLNSSEIQFLENLAIKNTRVGAYSRNILCFFYDICFDAPIEVSTSQKALVTKPTIEEILYTLDIYPNPANQFTSFSWEIFVPLKNCIYTVYDLNGIQKIRNEITQNKGVITIDTRHLKNGLYLINIENNNKSLQTLKFVVNNK